LSLFTGADRLRLPIGIDYREMCCASILSLEKLQLLKLNIYDKFGFSESITNILKIRYPFKDMDENKSQVLPGWKRFKHKIAISVSVGPLSVRGCYTGCNGSLQPQSELWHILLAH
jgi:hypothetical protein